MEKQAQLNLLTIDFLNPGALPNARNEFLSDCEIRGLRPATLSWYKHELHYFITWAQTAGANSLDEVSPDLLRRYFLELSSHRNKTGVSTAYRALRAWLRWAWEEYERAGACPMDKVKVAAPASEPKAGVSLADIDKLLSACGKGKHGKRDKAILLTLLDTGIRRRELCELDISALAGDTLHLAPDGTKTGRARVAFLSRDTRKALRAYLAQRKDLEENSPIFATQSGARLTVSGLRQVIRRLCALAGIPETGLHAFRRTFALETLRAGADVVSVSRLLGHQSIEVTKRYLAQVEDDLRAAHAATSPVEKLLRKGRRNG